MLLTPEFRNFVSRWLKKANKYRTDNIQNCFDKFFTLYVAFNRIYAEITLIILESKLKTLRSLPDKKGATKYFLDFIGDNRLVNAIESDKKTKDALNTVINLIEEEHFHIILNLITSEGQRTEDLKLVNDLKGNNAEAKGEAILLTIYKIRCNMFHGHKGFHEVQLELLIPIISLLEKVIQVGMEKLIDTNR